MRRIFTLVFIALVAIQFSSRAERVNIPGLELPKLIITEVRPDAEASAYIELTNMGDDTIDLEPFTIQSVNFNTRMLAFSDSVITPDRRNAALRNEIGFIKLQGKLAPGESYIVSSAWDAKTNRGYDVPIHNTAIAQISDLFVYKDERFNENGWINKPEWECFGFDSISDGRLRASEFGGYLLQWIYEKEEDVYDSTYVDNVNMFWYPDDNDQVGSIERQKGKWIFPIAGVEDAYTSSILVRKPDIAEGNLDWDQSRGLDAETSEWIVIPKNSSQQKAFTTVGSHGSYDLDYTVKDPEVIVIDEAQSTISVPWQLARGDSLASYFNLGEGMGWSYDYAPSFEDSASFLARTGDKFHLYAVGETLKQKDYTLEVREAESDIAMVFPVRQLLEDVEVVYDEETNETDSIITKYWSSGFRYGIVDGPVLDSIIGVSFATRKDTLLKYLVKPEGAEWEFIFVDDVERVDLKMGDKLKVTSEDGSAEKEYVISVDEHVMTNNATLATVTWPDIDKTRYPRWNVNDTLPEFTPLKTSYIIELRADEMKIPALQFKTQDLRATKVVKNAIDLDGTMEQRTTTVEVTAESDTVSLTYNFTFVKQNVPVQPYVAEPFIAEMIWNVRTQGCAVEIYNPGTEDLNLSQYMYVAGKTSQTWQEAVETTVSASQFENPTDGLKIYQTHYVPSMRWAADASADAWGASPDEDNPYVGAGFLKADNQTDPWVKGQDVWIMGVGTSATNAEQQKIRAEADFIFRGSSADETLYAWDSTKILHRETPIWNDPRHNMWLLKITNDSILDGTKDVRDASAYTLIDRFEQINDSLAGRSTKSGKGWTLIRKPSVTEGNLERVGGGNETAESSEWIIHQVNDTDWSHSKGVSNLGIHNMDPVTNYLSTVTSIDLKVTPGYEGDNLSITGNISDYTATTIAEVLDKADDSQTFAFMRGGEEVADDADLADGDLLEVTSGNGQSKTVYKLINSPLNDDTSLTAKAGSDLTVSDNKVSGVTLGMTLKEAVENLEVAETSVLNVLDEDGAFQPMVMHNLDSMIYDVMLSDKYTIEVVAESNDKESYTFDLGLASDEAILFSSILDIDQDNKVITEFPENITALAFLDIVYANEGASVKVVDKNGMERNDGFLYIDDIAVVTAADGQTTVEYTFIEQSGNSVNDFERRQSLFVKLYPNPVTNVLNIEGVDLASVNVYTLSGALMIAKDENVRKLDVSGIRSGIYVVKLTDVKGNVVIDKFLKK